MGIVVEFIPSILVGLGVDFLLYLTGICILKIVSLGLYKSKFCSYAEYKELKEKSFNRTFAHYFVGFFFYAIIFSVVWFN